MARTAKQGLRLGLYGGTFDPVHQGHLLGARDALEQHGLDAVIWIPCAQSPHKDAPALAPDRDRVAMIRKAIRGQEGFLLSETELRRGAPSYAIDTVAEFEREFPRAELFWLIGADQLPGLSRWHLYAELRRRVTFLLLDRPGAKRAARLPRGVISLPRPRQIDISATEIRARVKQNLPIDSMVPASVAAHVARRGLYL